MQNLKARLITIEDHNSLEYYESLRNILKISYRYSLEEFYKTLLEYKLDILSNGSFYMDIIHINLFHFLYTGEKQLTQEHFFIYCKIIEQFITIMDRQGIYFLKRLYSKKHKNPTNQKEKIKKYISMIEKHLFNIQKKIKDSRLHPYKDIIDIWYE